MADAFHRVIASDGNRPVGADRYALNAGDVGEWNGVVRIIGGHDFERLQVVIHWPLVEVLHAYQSYLRERALVDYRHALVVWASSLAYRKNKKQPTKPPILND